MEDENIERRAEQIILVKKVDEIGTLLTNFIEESREFHVSQDKKFADYFNGWDGTAHKKHHSFLEQLIIDDEANTKFWGKLKANVLEKTVLLIGGIIIALVASTSYHFTFDHNPSADEVVRIQAIIRSQQSKTNEAQAQTNKEQSKAAK